MQSVYCVVDDTFYSEHDNSHETLARLISPGQIVTTRYRHHSKLHTNTKQKPEEMQQHHVHAISPSSTSKQGKCSHRLPDPTGGHRATKSKRSGPHNY